MLDTKTKETLALLKGAAFETVIKSYTQPASAITGLQQYNLEGPAKRFVPVLTPLRNLIPRNGNGFGTAVNWKAVTKINSTRVQPGVQEGKRGAIISITTAEYNAAYRALGLEDEVTFEAQYAGRTFMDIKSTAVMNLLDSFFLFEEDIILGGNATIALGTGPTPAGVASGSGNTTTTRAAVVARIVPLTHQGYYNMGGQTPNLLAAGGGVKQVVVRTNADATTTTINLGAGIGSLASGAVSVTAGQQVLWTWTDVRGAFAYAIFTGASGAERLLDVSTTNKYTQVADEGATNQTFASLTAATDYSQDATVFDGILAQVANVANNGYYKSLDGGLLTADGAGSVVEIDNALRSFWDVSRLSPDTIWCNAQEFNNITKKVMSSGSSPILRLDMDGTQRSLMGGVLVTSYLNKFAPGGAKELQIKVHPNMPPGTLLFISNSLPYKLSGVPSIFEIEARQPYYAIEWPVVTRKWPYGVYVDEVLKCYAPFACGIIRNINNG